MSAAEKKENKIDPKFRQLLFERAVYSLVHGGGYDENGASELLQEKPNLIPLINTLGFGQILTFFESVQDKSNEALGEVLSSLEEFSGKKWPQWWTVENERLGWEASSFGSVTFDGALLLRSLLPQKDLVACLKRIEACPKLFSLMKVAVILKLEIPKIWQTLALRSDEALNTMLFRIEEIAHLDSDAWSSSSLPISKDFFEKLIAIPIRKPVVSDFLDQLPIEEKERGVTVLHNMQLSPDRNSQPSESVSEKKEENLSQVVDGAVKQGMLSAPRHEESPPNIWGFSMGDLEAEDDASEVQGMDLD